MCSHLSQLIFPLVKGYIRKGHALLALKDTVKAMQAFQAALEIDPNNAVSYLVQRTLSILDTLGQIGVSWLEGYTHSIDVNSQTVILKH